MTQAAALIWSDAQGERALSVVKTTAGVAAIKAALEAHSNAGVVEEFEGSDSVLSPTLSTAQYPTLRVQVDLTFRDATGSQARLILPAPKAAVFSADGDTVNAGAITDIISAAIGSLIAGSGNPVVAYVGGLIRRTRLPAIATVNVVTPGGGPMVTIDKNGAFIGTEPILNLIEGSNVTLTAADNPGSTRVDVTVAAAGGGGSGAVLAASAQGTGAGNYVTTSTSFVDVDGTNLVASVAAAAGDILLISFVTNITLPGGTNLGLTLKVGSSVLGDTLGLEFASSSGPSALTINVLHTVLAGEISGGTVTVKPQYLSSAGTSASIYNQTAVTRPHLSVLNLKH